MLNWKMVILEWEDDVFLLIKVMSEDNIDISIKKNEIYYTNMGFDYPLRDTAALRKLYKEVRSEELKSI